MDASRFKRREIQTRRVANNKPFEEPVTIVPKAVLPRPINREAATTPDKVPHLDDDSIKRLALRKKPSGQPYFPSSPSPRVENLPLATTAAQTPSELTELPIAISAVPTPAASPVRPKRARSPLKLFQNRRLVLARGWIMRAGLVGGALVILIVVALIAQGFDKLHKVFRGGAASVAALTTNVNPNQLKGEGDGRINILLMGRGGGNHDGPDLTDTMILASIDPVNHTEALVSIPRDLWVSVPHQGSMKINAAWEAGEFKYIGKVAPGSTDPKAIQAGYTEVDQVVGNVLGITINYNILVDFQAFSQAVDTIGGVTVNVPTTLVDPTMAWMNGGKPILATAGIQTFNGPSALTYVRSRETTSDFARSQRQRAVLLALKSKVETLGTLSNPIKISSLLNTFGNNVATDLSLNDASKLYSIVQGISDAKTNSIGFADPPNHYVTTANMAGQSVVVPIAGTYNYTAIQDFLRTQLPDGYVLKEHAPVLVLNGTAVPGLATQVENKLKSYSYNVVGAAIAPTNDYVQTVVIDLSHGTDPYTAHYLQQRFNISDITGLPDTRIQPNGAAFVIIVGNDATTSPKT